MDVLIFMETLESRVARLERSNRRLAALLGLGVAVGCAVGFQRVEDVVRARRFEVVDARGVPLAVLGPAREGAGGELLLRDREGERRASLTAEVGAASLGLQGGRAGDPAGTAALRADGAGARMGLVGAKAGISASVRKDVPRIVATDARGRETFAAPWK